MEQKKDSRHAAIVKYSLAGITMNVLLALAKIIIGLAICSNAVILDAVNGFADSLSSVLTIVSAMLGNKRPDKKHPMGYGRIEYLFSILITGIIMLIGAAAVIQAIYAIISPNDPPHYNMTTIAIMTVSLVFKLLYGVIMRRKGKEISSDAMIMTGADSLGDSLISIGILIAIAVFRIAGVNIEHYVCIVISIAIISTGIQMFKSSLDKVLGTRADEEYVAKIRKLLIMEDGVLNISNLVIHNYGENRHYGSVDIEVDENMRASEITVLSRRIIKHAEEEGLILTSVGVSGTNIEDPEASDIWDTILYEARKHKWILRAHSFTVDFEEKIISFYVVLDYSLKDRAERIDDFRKELEALYPDMKIEIFEGIDI